MATTVAVKIALCILTAALCVQTSQGTAWVVGNQKSGYTGMFIGRYDEWLVGNPRKVSYLVGSLNPDTNLGGICSGSWNQWSSLGNPAPGNFDFNCQNSVADISANTGNVGYYVGGLNHQGTTIALCYVAEHTSNLCDSDTVDDSNNLACVTYLECV